MIAAPEEYSRDGSGGFGEWNNCNTGDGGGEPLDHHPIAALANAPVKAARKARSMIRRFWLSGVSRQSGSFAASAHVTVVRPTLRYPPVRAAPQRYRAEGIRPTVESLVPRWTLVGRPFDITAATGGPHAR